jgi:hypothetical protein
VFRLIGRANRDAKRTPGPAGQGQPDLFQRLTQATTATGMRHGQALDLLGEPAHRTALVLADEHPNP